MSVKFELVDHSQQNAMVQRLIPGHYMPYFCYVSIESMIALGWLKRSIYTSLVLWYP